MGDLVVGGRAWALASPGARGGAHPGLPRPRGHRVRRPAAATRPRTADVRAARPRRAWVSDTGTLLATVTEALAREGSVGLIVPDRLVDATIAQVADPAAVLGRDVLDEPLETEFDTRLDIVPASLAKGPEFDHVVLFEPEAIGPDRVTGLRRLYVCLTARSPPSSCCTPRRCPTSRAA